jgi:hypothetical protein
LLNGIAFFHDHDHNSVASIKFGIFRTRISQHTDGPIGIGTPSEHPRQFKLKLKSRPSAISDSVIFIGIPAHCEQTSLCKFPEEAGASVFPSSF